MTPFVGVIGSGNIGRDPFDSRSFSGISRNLLLALRSRGALSRAFGVEVPAPHRYTLMALNYRRSRRLWRTAFYLDTRYYAALTRAVERALAPEDYSATFLQFGAYYDVPSIVGGRTRCMSYHDGNLAQMAASPFFPPELRRRAEDALVWERRVYGRLDMIFTMSDYLRRSFIQDFGVAPDRVRNVGAGPNFEVPAALPQKDYEAKKVLFVGIDFERKGGEQLLEAFGRVRQAHPDAELHVVGPQPPRNNMSRPAGVSFHGLLSREVPEQRSRFFELMRSCTLFVMPSRYEPYGVAVVEAMAFGMSVVATDGWAFPEMIGDTGHVIELDDLDALTERLDWMLADPNRRADLGRRARERVLRGFSWEKVADRMLAAAAL